MPIFHPSIDIKGLLKQPESVLQGLLFEAKGNQGVSSLEARAYLQDQAQLGKKVLSFGDCDNFDEYGEGCRGHLTSLTLPLKTGYFDAIWSGEKTEEYRLATPFWCKRLVDKALDTLVVTRGYPRRDDDRRRLQLPFRGLRHILVQHDHFGPQPVDVLAIRMDITDLMAAHIQAFAGAMKVHTTVLPHLLDAFPLRCRALGRYLVERQPELEPAIDQHLSTRGYASWRTSHIAHLARVIEPSAPPQQ